MGVATIAALRAAGVNRPSVTSTARSAPAAAASRWNSANTSRPIAVDGSYRLAWTATRVDNTGLNGARPIPSIPSSPEPPDPSQLHAEGLQEVDSELSKPSGVRRWSRLSRSSFHVDAVGSSAARSASSASSLSGSGAVAVRRSARTFRSISRRLSLAACSGFARISRIPSQPFSPDGTRLLSRPDAGGLGETYVRVLGRPDGRVEATLVDDEEIPYVVGWKGTDALLSPAGAGGITLADCYTPRATVLLCSTG